MEERLSADMKQGIEEEQFQVYFQPKYSLHTNQIVGAEALVRWIHPKEGMISPASFIPLFERNGLIKELDQYVWEKSAELISHWMKQKKQIVPISVNVSPIDIVTVLSEIVEKYEIKPELLHLEVTESTYAQDSGKIIRIVRKLQEKGFVIEMDDFGSGYSSLNMLAKLPVDILKLDMKFIQSIEDTENAKTIIDFIIGLAKWMKLPVIAEGVENQEQLGILKAMDCDYVQGYLFAKPMPEEEFGGKYLV